MNETRQKVQDDRGIKRALQKSMIVQQVLNTFVQFGQTCLMNEQREQERLRNA